MYMTRVVLKGLEPPNVIHSILCAAFPDRREHLWRIDNLEDSMELLVVSASSPMLQHIVKERGACGDRNKILPYAPFLGRLENDQVWSFRLCANPVEHKKPSSGKREKMHALHSAPEQLEWLDKQGLQNGFGVANCALSGEEWRVFKADKNDKRNATRVLAVTFEGLLTITDVEAFRKALMHGVGHSKAHGCGLLTVARE
jgi:CRISPR system Cascade subunit CasE